MGNAAVGYVSRSAVDRPGGVATIDLRPTAPSIADRLAAGVVTVAYRTPVCTCGWRGRRRAGGAMSCRGR
jgi:hypothetical protein